MYLCVEGKCACGNACVEYLERWGSVVCLCVYSDDDCFYYFPKVACTRSTLSRRVGCICSKCMEDLERWGSVVCLCVYSDDDCFYYFLKVA